MKLRSLLAPVAVVLVAQLALAAPVLDPADWLLDQVKILASPEMEGRESGSRGGERAAEHIIGVLRQAGLRPAGEAVEYRMTFSIPTRVSVGPDSRLELLQPSGRAFVLDSEWAPGSGSADGTVEAEVVFAGYGVSEPDLGYDDYSGIDVGGKIVLAMAGEPHRDDPSSPFARAQSRPVGQRAYKARVAWERGARALLLVHRPAAGADSLPALRDGRAAGELVVARVTRATADALLSTSGDRLETLRTRIETTLRPASRPLPGARVHLRVSLARESATAANLVGILPGTDPARAREAIVIGAHYDHLGRSGNGSLDSKQTAVHPGADDNASGTAGVLALARTFAAAGGTPRTLVFVLFAGEELGLLGAGAYVRAPAVPLDRTAAMVNLDMIGRMRDRRVDVGGVGSAHGLDAIVDAAARGLDLQVHRRESPYAPSDHASFYPHGVPVLFFHTGVHPDYHRTTDTWEKINAQGMESVVTLAARIIDQLAHDPAPAYVKIERAKLEPVNVGYSGSGASYFGVAPDPGDDAPGVRLSMVQPGGPADLAGFHDGDIVIRFDGLRVYTQEDLREAIASKKPRDTVDVVYLRDGREHLARAMLSLRPGH